MIFDQDDADRAMAEIDAMAVVVTNETLDALCDLLEKRAVSCDELARKRREETNTKSVLKAIDGELDAIRLDGKANGVRLAVSFIRDLQRGVLP